MEESQRLEITQYVTGVWKYGFLFVYLLSVKFSDIDILKRSEKRVSLCKKKDSTYIMEEL